RDRLYARRLERLAHAARRKARDGDLAPLAPAIGRVEAAPGEHGPRGPHLAASAEDHQVTLERSQVTGQRRRRPREPLIKLGFVSHAPIVPCRPRLCAAALRWRWQLQAGQRTLFGPVARRLA